MANDSVYGVAQQWVSECSSICLFVWRIYFYSVIRISWDCFGEIYIYICTIYSKFSRIARLYDLNCTRGTVERFNGFTSLWEYQKAFHLTLPFLFTILASSDVNAQQTIANVKYLPHTKMQMPHTHTQKMGVVFDIYRRLIVNSNSSHSKRAI